MRHDIHARGLLFLPSAAAFLLLLLRPQAAAAAARETLGNCFDALVPALFPFLVLTELLIGLGLPESAARLLGEPFERLFRIRRTALPAFLAGLLGGYPVGAAAAAAAFRRGDCSREEAGRLAVFADNCGPGFLFGVAGRILPSSGAALRLLLLEWAVSVWIGVLTGIGHNPSSVTADERRAAPAASELLVSSVRGGGRSMLNICAFVLFFGVIGAFLPCSPFLRGAVELTGGVLLLGTGAADRVLLAFLIGWGGLAVACQVCSVLSDSGIRSPMYLPMRLLHGGCMALCVALEEFAPICLPLLPLIGFGAILVKKCRIRRKSAV